LSKDALNWSKVT